MRPHISINVQDVSQSVDFYRRVFGKEPQKRTANYAKFDLDSPHLNFTLQSGGDRELSRVNHLGIEVGTTQEVRAWELKLIESGVLTTPENATNCCYAKQDKVWFKDPDGNAWEVFVVLAQLPLGDEAANLATPFDPPKNPGKKCC